MTKKRKIKSDASISSAERKKLRNRLWFYLKTPDYKPVTQKQLFKNLKIEKSRQDVANTILTEFIQKGMVEIEKNKLKTKTVVIENIKGVFHRHPKGFGFVTPDCGMQDVFIPKPHTSTALNQDIVSVKLTKSRKPEKGPEGIITDVVKRGKKTLVGTIYDTDKGHFVAFCPSLGDSKIVGVKPSEKHPIKVGDRVLLEILDWDAYPFALLTLPVKIIGHISDASTDIKAAICDYNLLDSFPQELTKELSKVPKEPSKTDLDGRVDLSSLETFTIDPDTAKDFDDALSISKEGDTYNLIVHIADVSHYVKENTLLDEEAKKRCNSTYFPSKCLPMLPEELSNGLCSLKEGVLRLTVSVFMQFDKSGTLSHYDIKRSFIKSDKRYTYKEAKLILDRKLESPHKPSLMLMKELCHLLQQKRRDRGSVDFAMEEISIKLDDKENPIGYEVIEYDITHQIVEEFMLKANEVVAKHLTDKNIEMIYRIHDEPSSSDIDNFYLLARALGFKVKKSQKKQDLQKLFDSAKATPHLHQLCLSFIKSMKLAIYSENNVGHYGLSLETYCHFTSPIRRYSDLVVHRLLFEPPATTEYLKTIGKKLSDQERVSFRAESSVVLLKKLRLLNRHYTETPDKLLEAIITKIKPYGIYFEITPLQFEGFIHISELGHEYFQYLEKSAMLNGEQTGRKFKAGVRITVHIDQLNLITGETKFKLSDPFRKKKVKKK